MMLNRGLPSPQEHRPVALIMGLGLRAAPARRPAARSHALAPAARDTARRAPRAARTGARAHACDPADPAAVAALFAAAAAEVGPPDVVVHDPSARVRFPVAELDPAEVARAIAVTAFGGCLVARQSGRRMAPRSAGAILFTGASASREGHARPAPFATGKVALRGPGQSLAREPGPQGAHVALAVIDGAIRSPRNQADPDAPLDPDAIAATCLALIDQPRSAWTHERALRPRTERF